MVVLEFEPFGWHTNFRSNCSALLSYLPEVSSRSSFAEREALSHTGLDAGMLLKSIIAIIHVDEVYQMWEALKHYRKLPYTFIYLFGYFLIADAINTTFMLVVLCQNERFTFSFLQQTYFGLAQSASAFIRSVYFVLLRDALACSRADIHQHRRVPVCSVASGYWCQENGGPVIAAWTRLCIRLIKYGRVVYCSMYRVDLRPVVGDDRVSGENATPEVF